MSIQLGLDLGTSTIKLIELERRGEKATLRRLGIAPNPIGSLSTATEQLRIKLAESVKKLIDETHGSVRKVWIGLPESQAYTRLISFPLMSNAELASAIKWEAEQHIPVPLAEVQLDYTIIYRPDKSVKEGTMQVLLVAAKTDAINRLVDLLAETGLDLIGIETTTISLVRALSGAQDPPTLLMHLGASSSDFSITAGGAIVITYSILTAGSALTRALQQNLGLSPNQAEQYKRAYGLNDAPLEGKVRDALLPVFRSIIGEAKKVINSYEINHRDQKIQRVLLSGGTAYLPNLPASVTTELGVNETLLADPFYGMDVDSNVTVPPERSVYAVAAGLARGRNG